MRKGFQIRMGGCSLDFRSGDDSQIKKKDSSQGLKEGEKEGSGGGEKGVQGECWAKILKHGILKKV